MLTDLKTEVEKVVTPILAGEGYDLVEIKLSRFKRNFRLQVFMDSDHGVALGDCAHMSGLMGTALDVADLLGDSYVLEVSSPGLDRPLLVDRDFRRRIGKRIEIQMVDGDCEITVQGDLTGIENGNLIVSGDDGLVEIALAKVRQGRIII